MIIIMKILENGLCKINYSESLHELVDTTIILLQDKIKEYESFFDITLDEQVVVNYFDDLDEFRKFICEIREEDTLPLYAEGTYDGGMINAYIEANSQFERRFTASHELFHILYLKHILNNDYSKRIVWYDEGMAQYMSGEKDYLNDVSEFKLFYQKVKKQTKKIPILNDLEHGNLFCNDDYNGYDLCYLAIRYLSEILNKNEFKELMYNLDEINQLGNDIAHKMFIYFDDKFNYSN